MSPPGLFDKDANRSRAIISLWGIQIYSGAQISKSIYSLHRHNIESFILVSGLENK